MADFTSGFWNYYIIIPTVLGIIACFLLIRWLSADIPADQQGKEMNHVWDEDLEELNNPLPRWWLNHVLHHTVFRHRLSGVVSGPGHLQGLLGWTSSRPV